MVERRKIKKKGQETPVDDESKATKIEYAVAKFMISSVPSKKTKLLGVPVTYFNASKAIDTLLDSQWAKGENALFTDRESVVYFCNKMLLHKFFHRAKKIAVSDKDYSVKELKKRKEKEEAKKKENKDEGDSKPDKVEEDKKAKKKTKIKLDMHLEQIFVDSSDAYVWIYDPIPFWYYIVGALLLFGAVAICLYPLWPPIVRQGVYYLSLLAAGFLVVILALTVLRFVIFMLIWILSLGKHHFWILPNLTEDVGFFESFWPLYDYAYRGQFSDSKKPSKKKKKTTDDGKERSSNGDSKTENEEATKANQSACDIDRREEAEDERLGDRGQGISEGRSDSESNSFELLNGEEFSSDPNASDREKSKDL